VENKRNILIMLVVLTVIAISLKIPASGGSIFSDSFSFLEEKDRDDIHFSLGTELAKLIKPDNNSIIIAHVNAEDINLNEWNYSKTFDTGKAKEMGTEPPADTLILQELIERKLKVDAARQMGIYPSEQEIEAYVNEQRDLAKKGDCSDLDSILRGWKISENEFFELMRETWADSIAIERWYKKAVISQVAKPDDPQGEAAYTEKLQDAYHKELKILKQTATIEITPSGSELGLSFTE
jgi:hypothetical protein